MGTKGTIAGGIAAQSGWVERLIPGYLDIWRRNVRRLLAHGPRSVAGLCADAGIHPDSRAEIIARFAREGVVSLNDKLDVVSLPAGAAGLAAVHPLALAVASEFSATLQPSSHPGKPGTWIIRCVRCSAGWMVGEEDIGSPGGAFHVRSVLAHLGVHAGEIGGGR